MKFVLIDDTRALNVDTIKELTLVKNTRGEATLMLQVEQIGQMIQIGVAGEYVEGVIASL